MTGLYVVWLIACAVFDLHSRKLPNVLTLGAYVPALIVIASTQQSVTGAAYSAALLGWLLGIGLTLPGYVFRQLGAGDVKLLSAMGLLSDWQFVLYAYVIAGLFAGGIVIITLASHRYLPFINLQLERFGYQLPLPARLSQTKLPFGAILAIAGVLICWRGG